MVNRSEHAHMLSQTDTHTWCRSRQLWSFHWWCRRGLDIHFSL